MNVPKCIAIVPDGNRRWGKKNVVPAYDAHSAGRETVHKVTERAFGIGVEQVVVWCASVDNIKNRDGHEIEYLVLLLKEELKRSLNDADYQLHVCGFWQPFVEDRELEELVRAAEVKRAERWYVTRHLTLLFCYDGSAEFSHACRAIVEEKRELSPLGLRHCSTTSHVPDVDILIRTLGEESGEVARHVPILPFCMTSNTMVAYPRKYWPDFTAEDFDQIIGGWANMHRRNGA